MQNYGGMNNMFLGYYPPLNPYKKDENKGVKGYYTPCNRT